MYVELEILHLPVSLRLAALSNVQTPVVSPGFLESSHFDVLDYANHQISKEEDVFQYD